MMIKRVSMAYIRMVKRQKILQYLFQIIKIDFNYNIFCLLIVLVLVEGIYTLETRLIIIIKSIKFIYIDSVNQLSQNNILLLKIP